VDHRETDDVVLDELTTVDDRVKQRKAEAQRRIRKVKKATDGNVQLVVCKDCGK
jgi:hypothetical protein